jgi:hypothetical protein
LVMVVLRWGERPERRGGEIGRGRKRGVTRGDGEKDKRGREAGKIRERGKRGREAAGKWEKQGKGA